MSDHCDGFEIEEVIAQADGVVLGNIFDKHTKNKSFISCPSA